ncbi:MAG: hypothetical protein II073_08350 [Lachnospiraceae bacterium]|nr:hypothetical protein [Lachnospiraceae bacterium]
MTNTKIVILHRRELIYTAIFVGLIGIFLLLTLILFFPGTHTKEPKQQALYKPGIYTTTMRLNDSQLNLEVVVDTNHINDVSFTNLDDSVSAMYPLLAPSLKEISSQLANNIPLSEVEVKKDGKYTQTLLLEYIKKALKKAKCKENSKN